MIDEKKIQEAAAGMFNVGGLVNTVERIAFKEGVEWFKKALWHTEDEIPEDGRIILVKGWYDCKRSGDYIIINTTEDINYDDADPDRKYQWECFCSCAGVPITWCYIEDLLPKGGEK